MSETGAGFPSTSATVEVLAGVAELPLAPQAPHDVDGLAEPGDARLGVGLVDAGDGVVVLQPSGAEAEHEPAFGEQIDRGGLLGQHDRVAEVDAGDERADLEVGRDRRRGHDRRDRGELVAEVVVDLEAHVAEVFSLAGDVGPLLGRAGLRGLRTESERTR